MTTHIYGLLIDSGFQIQDLPGKSRIIKRIGSIYLKAEKLDFFSRLQLLSPGDKVMSVTKQWWHFFRMLVAESVYGWPFSNFGASKVGIRQQYHKLVTNIKLSTSVNSPRRQSLTSILPIARAILPSQAQNISYRSFHRNNAWRINMLIKRFYRTKITELKCQIL